MDRMGRRTDKEGRGEKLPRLCRSIVNMLNNILNQAIQKVGRRRACLLGRSKTPPSIKKRTGRDPQSVFTN